MGLDGIHHISAITADAAANVDFYARVMGLRLVKKTVNQDDPTVYHLFYADENGSPGADLTFFEYPRLRRGRAGDGMVHRIVWRVASPGSLAYWRERLAAEGIATRDVEGRLRFADPEGLGHELAVVDTADAPLVARHAEVPYEHALRGFDGVRVYASDPARSDAFLEEGLGMVRTARGWEARGETRGGRYDYDPPPAERGLRGAGTVHHVAFATTHDEIDGWRRRVREAGAHPTGIVERFYFRSVYLQEPSGVIVEFATMGPGFTADEDLDHLGERLSLPPAFEAVRARAEASLTPLPDTRRWRPRTSAAGAAR